MFNTKEKFGNRVKFYRKTRQMTQEQLAERVNLNARQISRIESGANFVSMATLSMLCIVFNVEVYQLFLFKMNREEIYSQPKHMIYFSAENKDNCTKFQRLDTDEIFYIKDFSPYKMEAKFSELAKSQNQPVSILFKENDKIILDIVYYRSGAFKVYNREKSKILDTNLLKMFDEIIKLSSNQTMLNFIWCAIKACKSKAARKRLKSLLEGMEIADNMK